MHIFRNDSGKCEAVFLISISLLSQVTLNHRCVDFHVLSHFIITKWTGLRLSVSLNAVVALQTQLSAFKQKKTSWSGSPGNSSSQCIFVLRSIQGKSFFHEGMNVLLYISHHRLSLLPLLVFILILWQWKEYEAGKTCLLDSFYMCMEIKHEQDLLWWYLKYA